MQHRCHLSGCGGACAVTQRTVSGRAISKCSVGERVRRHADVLEAEGGRLGERDRSLRLAPRPGDARRSEEGGDVGCRLRRRGVGVGRAGQLARGLGLWGVSKLPPLKKIFMRHAMGLVGDLPEIIK